MKRKQKVFLVLLAVCVIAVGFRMLQPQGQAWEAQTPTQAEEIKTLQKSKNSPDTGTSMIGHTEAQEETETLGYKYNQDAARKMDIDISYLSNFLGEGKQFILKKQIQQLAGEGARSADCLPYTRSDADGMRLEFYIFLDTGDILQGSYDFQNGKTSVQESGLTEEDVWGLKAEEEEWMRQEEEKAEEKERKRVAKRAKEAARESEEAARKQQGKETDTVAETGQPVEIELEEEE